MTLRKSQPTAIEFRRYLRQIIESQRPRRIVFVIDNLDRIDPAEALSLWSIMVGMVSDETHRMDPKIEPVVVLPFDPIALEKIVPGGRLQGHTASDMIEKSFDITFEVPPPVLSNWRSYFIDQYAECGLSKWTHNSPTELYWTIRGFEKYLGDARITPRRINRFLNRVISLAQQQVATVGPALLAYYLANEEEIQANCLAFLQSNRPDFAEGNNWQLKVAAIAFGTTEKEAAQVVLTDELFDAVSARKRVDFDRLKEVSGFDEVIRNFVDAPPSNDAGEVDVRPLNALAAYAVISSPGDAVLWSRLWETWKCAPSSEAEDDLLGPAVMAFLAMVPESVGRNMGIVTSRILQQIRVVRNPEAARELVSVGDKLVQVAAEEEIDLEVDIGTDISLLLSVIASADQPNSFSAAMRSRSTFKDVADHVIARIEGTIPLFGPSDFKVVEDRLQQGQVVGEKEEFFARVGEGLKEIVSDAEASDDTLVASAQVLGTLKEKKLRYIGIIDELESAGTLSSAVGKAVENGADAVASAMTALRLSALKMPSADDIETIAGWLENGENAERLIGSMKRINNGSFLPALRNIEAAGNDIDRILRPLLTQAVRKKSIGARAHPDWLLRIFPKLAGWLSPGELETYADLVSTWTDISDELGKISDADFLAYTSKLSTRKSAVFLGQRIKGFDSKRFSRMVTSGDELWQAYNRLKPDIGSGFSAKSILYESLHGVLSGSMGVVGRRVADRAIKLLPFLTEDARKQLLRNVVTTAVEAGNVEAIITLSMTDGFKTYLSRPKVASFVIEGLFTKLRRTRDGQTFVERHAEALKQTSGSMRDDIRKTLTRSSRSTDIKTAEWARIVKEKGGFID